MQTPSPDKPPHPQRREPLRWMAAAALLLAFLSICCVAQAVTFLLAPRNQRSNLDLRSKLLADYAPWNIDLPLPNIGPEVPAAQAADLAAATSVASLGTATPVIVGTAPTAELAIVPPVANAPTPTLPGVGTVPPAPTATSPAIAGGATRTPTRAPTITPTEAGGAIVTDTPRPTSVATPAPTATETREPQHSTTTPTNAPPTTAPTDKPDATTPPSRVPTNPPTNTSEPTAIPPTTAPPPQATDTPKPTVNPTDKPAKTATPTIAPTIAPTVTPTRSPTITPTRAPTVTPTRAPTLTPTPTDTPVTPSATPTNTPVTPSVTPTNTPVTPSATPTVGTIDVVKLPSADPTTNGALFQYTLTVTNRTGAPIDVTSIQDTVDLQFTVLTCTSSQGTCIPPIGPGAPVNWSGPITLANNASLQLVIEGNFMGVPSGSSMCNTTFTVTTSAGSVSRNNTACVTVN